MLVPNKLQQEINSVMTRLTLKEQIYQDKPSEQNNLSLEETAKSTTHTLLKAISRFKASLEAVTDKEFDRLTLIKNILEYISSIPNYEANSIKQELAQLICQSYPAYTESTTILTDLSQVISNNENLNASLLGVLENDVERVNIACRALYFLETELNVLQESLSQKVAHLSPKLSVNLNQQESLSKKISNSNEALMNVDEKIKDMEKTPQYHSTHWEIRLEFFKGQRESLVQEIQELNTSSGKLEGELRDIPELLATAKSALAHVEEIISEKDLIKKATQAEKMLKKFENQAKMPELSKVGLYRTQDASTNAGAVNSNNGQIASPPALKTSM